MNPSSHQYTVHILVWEQAAVFAQPLRETVFVHEQGVRIEEEWDEWDAVSDHAIVFGASGLAVGTGRLLPPEPATPGEARIGRMAVLKESRGNGAGMALLDALVALAAARGLETLVLHAQTQALGFYQRCGFVAEGPEFIEANIPHFTMRRLLASPRV